MYRRYGKRTLELLVASGLLFLFSPLIILTAVLIYLREGKPIFFRQLRPGLLARPFTIVKFRTMDEKVDRRGELLTDAERLTSLGRFLRNSSLDELPELINVIKGEMSLIGPRPLLMDYLDRYSAEQMRRHEVRPGITGWAQVNGRNALSWEEKFEMDVWYVDNLSIYLDLKIIWITFWKILLREGINQPGEATAKAFKGSGKNTRAFERNGV